MSEKYTHEKTRLWSELLIRASGETRAVNDNENLRFPRSIRGREVRDDDFISLQSEHVIDGQLRKCRKRYLEMITDGA